MSQGIRHAPLFTFLLTTAHPLGARTPILSAVFFLFHVYDGQVSFSLIPEGNQGKVLSSYYSLDCVNMSKIYQVENIGVEPMTSCMPCKRSSQLS